MKGFVVVTLTCDGPACNFSMLKYLGCDLIKDQSVTKFKCNDSVMFAFIDPCHVVKLIRNTFGELKFLYDANSRKIDFEYLERLLLL